MIQLPIFIFLLTNIYDHFLSNCEVYQYIIQTIYPSKFVYLYLYYAEIYAFFGTLDMGNENELGHENSNEDTSENGIGKYGRSEGVMTIIYEDEYGDEHTKTVELATNIERPVFANVNHEQEEPEGKPERASQWWVSIFLAAGVAMMLFGAISYKRKVDKLKREYGNEDL